MGKVSARNLILARTRPRGASATPVLSTVKLACSQCVKSFIRRGDLKRHEQLHTGVKNHECIVCGKRFSQNSGLKTHMNVHTGNKPYRCAFEGCGAEFGDPSSHARHKKETHLVDYRYECPFSNETEKCGSAIKRRSAFAQHLKKKHDMTATASELDCMKKVFRSPTGQRRKSNHADVSRTVAPTFAPTPVHPYHADVLERNYGSWETSPHFFDHKLETELFSNRSHLQQGDDGPILSAPSGSASSTETLIYPWAHFKHEEYSDSTLLSEYPVDYPQTVATMAHLPSSMSPSPPCSPDEYSVPSTPLSVRELQRTGQSPHIQSPHIHYDRQIFNQHATAGTPSHAFYEFGHNSYDIHQPKGYGFPQPHFNINEVQQSPAQSWPAWE